MDHVYEVTGVSERCTCQVLDQPHSAQRHVRKVAELEEQVVALASHYGRYGYGRITALLGNECLSMDVARTIKSQDVMDQLYKLFFPRETPVRIR